MGESYGIPKVSSCRNIVACLNRHTEFAYKCLLMLMWVGTSIASDD